MYWLKSGLLSLGFIYSVSAYDHYEFDGMLMGVADVSDHGKGLGKRTHA